jgi:hypothetical protein
LSTEVATAKRRVQQPRMIHLLPNPDQGHPNPPQLFLLLTLKRPRDRMLKTRMTGRHQVTKARKNPRSRQLQRNRFLTSKAIGMILAMKKENLLQLQLLLRRVCHSVAILSLADNIL